MAIRAVILDVGGVLARSGDRSHHRQWEARLGLAEGQLASLVAANPVSRQAYAGRATREAVWAEVGRQLKLGPAELEALKTDFWRGGVWDEELLAYVRSLRPQYRTGVISDAWPGAREAIRGYVNGETFDVIVYSAEEGICKPDPAIYQRALERLGVAASEAVYVDDTPECVEGARALGLEAIHYDGRFSITERLRGVLGEG